MICHICGLSNEDAVSCAACEATLVEPPAIDSGDGNALPAGTLLLDGSYLIGSVLNRSNFSITYLGRHTAERRYVVVKEFFPRGCARTECEVRPPCGQPSVDYAAARKAFLFQGQSLSRFRHANLAAVQACFEENNTAYMAMEFVRGKSLQQLVTQRGPLDEQAGLHTIREIGNGLSSLHGVNLLHCDVQPANVMVCSAENFSQPSASGSKNQPERVLLIDFDFHQPLQPITADDRFSSLILAEPIQTGSPGFAALEQYGTRSNLSERTDIYGLGAVAYFLLTGHAPIQALGRAQGEVLASPRDLNSAITHATSNAVMWALELQAGDRPPTVEEFFDGWPRHADAPSLRGAAMPTPTVPESARRRFLAPKTVGHESKGYASKSIERAPLEAPRHSLARWAPRVAVASLTGLVLALGVAPKLQRTSQDSQTQIAALPTWEHPRPLQPPMLSPELPVTPKQPLAVLGTKQRIPSREVAQPNQPLLPTATPKVLSDAREPIRDQNRQLEAKKEVRSVVSSPKQSARGVPQRIVQVRENVPRAYESSAEKAAIPLRRNRNEGPLVARDGTDEVSTPRSRLRLPRIERRPLRRENRARRLADFNPIERRPDRVRPVVREAGLPNLSSNEAGLPPLQSD